MMVSWLDHTIQQRNQDLAPIHHHQELGFRFASQIPLVQKLNAHQHEKNPLVQKRYQLQFCNQW